nr:MAG TPA: hypothetical protein [Caudoviricetes sp.]
MKVHFYRSIQEVFSGFVIAAMKTYIENKKDNLFELLGVELNDKFVY